MGLVFVFVVVGLLAFAIPYVGWVVGLAFWGAAVSRLTRRQPMKASAIRDRVRAPVAPRSPWPVAIEPSRQAAPTSRPPERRTASREVGHHVPGQPIRLSGRGRQAVVGEQYHPDGVRAALAGRTPPPPGDWDAALPVTAVLIREPKNPHDANAVRVDVRTARGLATVGYIPADDAIDYAPGLNELAARGRYGEVAGRIVAGHAHPQVYLHVAGPPVMPFANELPDGAEVLDAERQCAVTNENKHQDSLTPYAPGSESTVVWFTFERCEVPSGKNAGEETLGVLLDGRPVGNLTAQQGQRYGRRIFPSLDKGTTVACEGAITRDAKGVLQAVLFLPKVD